MNEAEDPGGEVSHVRTFRMKDFLVAFTKDAPKFKLRRSPAPSGHKRFDLCENTTVLDTG